MTRTLCPRCVSVPALLLLALLGSGCLGRRSYSKHQFVLAAARPAQPPGQTRNIVVAVRAFTVDPTYDSRGLLYRKGESEYQSDFYHEFLIAPQALITSQTRNWLAQSGLFQTVLEPGSLLDATHVLEGSVLALYGDLRGQDLPQAVLQIRFFLIATQDSKFQVVFTRDYRASCPAREKTADALVAAQDQCLAQILTELEKDLGTAL
jgi:cholesterol transport system auxiliary component